MRGEGRRGRGEEKGGDERRGRVAGGEERREEGNNARGRVDRTAGERGPLSGRGRGEEVACLEPCRCCLHPLS